jgi:hypothetical protein
MSQDRKVLGTFCMYYRDVRHPGADDVQLIDYASRIAGIAIERERSRSALTTVFEHIKKSEAELRTIIDVIPQLITAVGADGRFLYANQHTPAAVPEGAPVVRNRRTPWIAGALVVVAAVFAGYFFFHRPTKLTEKDTVVLADFVNTTGDPIFDGTLRQGLSVQLEQSAFLSIVSDQQIQQTLQMMGQKPDGKLTPEIARELCQRTASAVVLDGSVAQIGTPYLLTVKEVNCSNGETRQMSNFLQVDGCSRRR